MNHVVLAIFLFLGFICFLAEVRIFYWESKKLENTIDPNTDLRLVYFDPDEELMHLRKMRGVTTAVPVRTKSKPVEYKQLVALGKRKNQPLSADDKTAAQVYNESRERLFRHREWPDHGTCFCPECEAKRFDQ